MADYTYSAYSVGGKFNTQPGLISATSVSEAEKKVKALVSHEITVTLDEHLPSSDGFTSGEIIRVMDRGVLV